MNAFETTLSVYQQMPGPGGWWYTEARVAAINPSMNVNLVGIGSTPSASLADFARQLGEHLDKELVT